VYELKELSAKHQNDRQKIENESEGSRDKNDILRNEIPLDLIGAPE
jgi:hypothetical protein